MCTTGVDRYVKFSREIDQRIHPTLSLIKTRKLDLMLGVEQVIVYQVQFAICDPCVTIQLYIVTINHTSILLTINLC